MTALRGIKVLDLSRLLPGPIATMFLADYGAEVIKIEDPSDGDYSRQTTYPIDKTSGMSKRFLILNRNKKSVALNLKDPKGKEIFIQIVRESDVLLEGFRPGVMERLGLDYETLAKKNPKLIYCSLTGYGQKGQMAKMAGHDINYIGLSGILDNIGTEDKPVLPGVQIADLTGALMSLVGILIALQSRNQTGKGQYIDISMHRNMFLWLISLLCYHISDWEVLPRGRQNLGGGLARYNIYETKEGKYLAVGALEEKFWVKLCNELEVPELSKYYDKPFKAQAKAKNKLQEIFLTRELNYWCHMFEGKDCCVTPIYSIAEALEENKAEVLINTEIGIQLINPVLMSNNKVEYKNTAPQHGEHTYDFLQMLGYTEIQIKKMARDGIIKLFNLSSAPLKT